MVPSSGLPARRRASGGSIPCTIALVTRCSSGSLSRSSTALSSGVSPPDCSSRTRLPSASAVSRTMRGNRPNTVAIGSSRVSIRVDSSRLSVFSSASDGLVQPVQLLARAGPPRPARDRPRPAPSAGSAPRPAPRAARRAGGSPPGPRCPPCPRPPPRRRPPVRLAPLGLGVRRRRRRRLPSTGAPARRSRAAGAGSSSGDALPHQVRPAARRRSTSSAAAASVAPLGAAVRSSPHASSRAWATSRIGARPIIAELPLTVCRRPGSEASSSSAGSPSRQRRSSSTNVSATCSASGRHSRT